MSKPGVPPAGFKNKVKLESPEGELRVLNLKEQILHLIKAIRQGKLRSKGRAGAVKFIYPSPLDTR
jgi:hypothetical protein